MPDKNTQPDPWAQAAQEYAKYHSNQASGTSQPPSAQAQPENNPDAWKLWQSTANNGSTPNTFSFGSSPSDVGATIFNHAKNVIAGPYHALADAPRNATEQNIDTLIPELPHAANGMIGSVHPLNRLMLGAYRTLVEPSVEPLSQLKTDKTFDQKANHVMDAIPIVGPWARQIENDTIQHGAVAGLAGLATDIAAPKFAGKGLSAGLRATGFPLRYLAATPAERTLWQTRQIVSGTPEELLTRALKPSVAYPEFEDQLNKELPKINGQLSGEMPNARFPGIEGFKDAADRAKQDIHNRFETARAPVNDSLVDTTPMVEPQVRSLPAINKFENPDLEDATRSRVASIYDKTPFERTVTSPILDEFGHPITRTELVTPEKPTLNEVDSIRRDANSKLNSYFDKNPSDRHAAESNPRIARLKAIDDSARDLEYQRIAEHQLRNNPGAAAAGQTIEGIKQGIADSQKSYGNLKDIKDVAEKRQTVFSRENPISLAEAVSLRNPLTGLVNFFGQRWLRDATNSDALVNSALDRYNNPQRTDFATPVIPRTLTWPSLGKWGVQLDLMRLGKGMDRSGEFLKNRPLLGNPLFYTEQRNDPDDEH